MNKIHLIIPMSGQGVRFQKAGYLETKPLVPVSGVPMIERVLRQFPVDWPVVFILSEAQKKTPLPSLLKRLRPKGRISFIPPHKKGPSFAIQKGLTHVPAAAPVLVSYCDYGMAWDPQRFTDFVSNSQCDACVVSYRGFHAHYLNPVTYAYSRMVGDKVVEVQEKKSFTDNRENEFASCGAYYFKSASLLRRSIVHQFKKNLNFGGEYYTSLTVEALLRQNKKADVRVFEIEGFFQWGTPEDVRDFEYWEKTFKAHVKNLTSANRVDQILIPMAGLGSRFSKLTKTPKPFIPINGKAMYLNAIQSLPASPRPVVVTTKAGKAYIKDNSHLTLSLPKTPAGQALTTLEGAKVLNQKSEVIVSSCDHAIVLDPQQWAAFHKRPGCDAAIFTIKGYPGARRTPLSYSYVAVENESSAFPLLKNVSLKKPVSSVPTNDHLLMGTFWFRTVGLLQKSIRQLLAEKVLVNGEYYLDAVFDVIKRQGGTVKVIPVDGYVCWGDPDAMAESLYWQEQYTGHQLKPRSRFPEVQLDA